MQNVAFLDNTLLALDENCSLSRNLLKFTNDLLAAIHESIQGIRNPSLVAELLHQLLRCTKIMARHAREEMVDGLKLKAAVNEIQPLGAIDIHRSSEHLLGERFVWAKFSGAHGEVGECDLCVQWHRDHVADQEKREPS